MTTQSEDLLKAYARNQERIEYRHKRIKANVHMLVELGEILISDPESMSPTSLERFVVENGTFVFNRSRVSCNTLKEIAEDIKKLEGLRHEEYTLKGRIEREGLGRYISD